MQLFYFFGIILEETKEKETKDRRIKISEDMKDSNLKKNWNTLKIKKKKKELEKLENWKTEKLKVE